jgi:hypothetical protein
MRTFGLIVTAAVVGVIAASTACTDPEPAGTGGGDCSPNPFQCTGNQVCWPSEDVSSFICLDARADKQVGDTCAFIGGQVTCPVGSVCIVQGPGDGICTPYCDPANGHGCPGFASCVKYTIDAPSGTKSYTLLACDAATIGAGSSTASTGTGG